MRQTVEWGAGEYTSYLERARQELRREITICDRGAAARGAVGQRFRWYADLARETLERVERELDESYAALEHPRTLFFRLICDVADRFSDPPALEVLLRSRAGLGVLEHQLRSQGALAGSLEPAIQVEALWNVVRRIDPGYEQLLTESSEEFDRRNRRWWRIPPRNPEKYLFGSFWTEAERHLVLHGTRNRLGAQDLDRWEVDRRAAGRLEKGKGGWGRLKREADQDWRNPDRTDSLEDLASSQPDPEGTALILLSHLEGVITSREETETLMSIAREPHLNASESSNDAGLSRAGFRSLQARARANRTRDPTSR